MSDLRTKGNPYPSNKLKQMVGISDDIEYTYQNISSFLKNINNGINYELYDECIEYELQDKF